MGIQMGYAVASHKPFTGLELMEAGDLPVTIEDCIAEKAKSDPSSGLLKVVMKVTQGHRYAGRVLFYRLNLWNASADACEKAHEQLTSLCLCVGIQGTLNDTDELKGRQLRVTIDNTGQYNNIKSLLDMNGNDPGKGPVNAGLPGGPGIPPMTGGAFQPQQMGQIGSGQPMIPPGATPGGFPGGAPQQQFAQPQQPAQYQQPQQFQPPVQQQMPMQQPVPYQQQPAPQQGNPFGAPPQQAQPQYPQQQYQPQAQPQQNPAQGFQGQGQQQAPPTMFPHS